MTPLATNQTKTCKDCNSSMRLLDGKYGKFWSCSAYPKCKGTAKFFPGSSANEPAVKSTIRSTAKPGSFSLLAGVKEAATTALLDGSDEQQTIWTEMNTGTGHLAVNAVAGSGKTTTVIQGVMRMSKSLLITIVAFNKHIAGEMKSKLPAGYDNVEALTYHSLGYRALMNKFPELLKGKRIDNWKVANLVDAYGAKHGLDKSEDWKDVKSAAVKLVSSCKNHLFEGTQGQLEELVDRYDIEAPEQCYAIVKPVLKANLEATHTIDFDDMIWMPVRLKLEFPKIDMLIVDEFQDTNHAQHELTMLAGKGARIMIVGDSHQAIYGFRGADTDAIHRMVMKLEKETGMKCTELPLTVTRRCPKSHVKLAQLLVPKISAMENAPEGKVYNWTAEKALDAMLPGDLVVCRVNKHLIPAAYELIRRGIKPVVRGREIGTGLAGLVQQLRAYSIQDLDEKLGNYFMLEEVKFLAMGYKGTGRLAALQDRVECLRELMVGMETVPALLARINELFADFDADGKPVNAVVLGTVHRTKGLEGNRVFILAPELMPHPMAKQDWSRGQELNLCYVAVTRAKYGKDSEGELVFVGEMPPMLAERMPVVKESDSNLDEDGDEDGNENEIDPYAGLDVADLDENYGGER